MEKKFSINEYEGCFRTEGLNDCGCPNFEIALALDSAVGFNYCYQVANKLLEGLQVEDGLFIPNLIEDRARSIIKSAFFFKVDIDGKSIYRVVISDDNDFFPWSQAGGLECEVSYKSQITFEKDMAFLLRVDDFGNLDDRERASTPILKDFVKHDDKYVLPVQFIVVDGLETEFLCVSCFRTMNEIVNEIGLADSLFDIKMDCVCVPMHHF